MVSDSKQDIQSRLENVAAGSARLYAQSFLGRAWLADYVADVDSVCDELRAEIERLTFLHKQDHALADRYQEHRETAEAESERLRAALREIYGHATANNDGQPCCDTVVMLAKAALHPTPA